MPGEPQRWTFADANRTRDWRVFSKRSQIMLRIGSRGFCRKMSEAVRLIGSTSLTLACASLQRARFFNDVSGAKTHVVYDPASPHILDRMELWLFEPQRNNRHIYRHVQLGVDVPASLIPEQHGVSPYLDVGRDFLEIQNPRPIHLRSLGGV